MGNGTTQGEKVYPGADALKTGEGHRGVPLGRSSNGGEMLVLTRKTNQSIMIGDDIEVSVLAVSRDKIRLGITAPREVPVFRKEVYLSIKGDGEVKVGNGE